jgi:hypothetical protein
VGGAEAAGDAATRRRLAAGWSSSSGSGELPLERRASRRRCMLSSSKSRKGRLAVEGSGEVSTSMPMGPPALESTLPALAATSGISSSASLAAAAASVAAAATFLNLAGG